MSDTKRIVVNNKYTYETDLDLKVGDEVVLPGKRGGGWKGKVTALESAYKGDCLKVVQKVGDNTKEVNDDAKDSPAGTAAQRNPADP